MDQNQVLIMVSCSFQLKRKLSETEAKFFVLSSNTERFALLLSKTVDFRCKTKKKQSKKTNQKRRNKTQRKETKLSATSGNGRAKQLQM
jgi:hypothetical protein